MIAQLDLVRLKLLKATLGFSFLRELFMNRAARVFTLFLIAISFYFFICHYFPLWVLLAGPILWGVPHLLSSIRYSTLSFQKTNRQKIIYFHFVIWLAIFGYRLAIDVFKKPVFLAEEYLLVESCAVILSFFIQIILSKKLQAKHFFYLLGFSALIYSTHFYPIETALGLLIGHNYLALIPWFTSCQNQSDRKVFYISSSLFILLSFVIYKGQFDIIYNWTQPFLVKNEGISFLNWNFKSIVEPFTTTDVTTAEFDENFWYRFVSLYAFSQAIHYFIWMKAIPENYQKQNFPPSFQWSFQKLATDFGFSSILFLITLVLAGIGLWFFIEFQTARLVYFGLASYHGFMEISALPFLKSNMKDSDHV